MHQLALRIHCLASINPPSVLPKKLTLLLVFFAATGTLNIYTTTYKSMPAQDTTRRLRPQNISQDITSFHGLQTISTYDTTRTDASAAHLQQAYQAMLASQQAETEKLALYRAAADAARLAEWEFHNAVLGAQLLIGGVQR